MGGVVSSGQNNDDLIDNLLEADYIKTSIIERVFRAVDRAEYFSPEARGNAYKDLAWKSGNLHLSAPCIYSEVLEGLCLEPGLSFMNLGSGTGYLSTMVGLILGSYGVNHGIEFHADVVQYANKKLEDFKRYSGAVDEFDFAEPKFIRGNCLCLTSDCNARYDRVYCGAACPEQYETYMKNLVKIGGILVMPLNDSLMQIKRTSETTWEAHPLLPVSFASLIQPLEGVLQEWVQMIEVEPPTLQALCRSVIRNMLRKNIELEHPPVKKPAPVTRAVKKKRALRRMVVPLFDSEESSDDDRQVRIGGVRNRNAGRATFREESDNLLSFVLGSFRDGRNLFSVPAAHNNRGRDNPEAEQSSEDNRMETDTAESTEESEKKSKLDTKVETQAVIEHNPSTSQNGTDNSQTIGSNGKGSSSTSNHQPEEMAQEAEENRLETIDKIHDVFVDVLSVLRGEESQEDEGNIDEPSRHIDEEEHELETEQEKPGTSEFQENKKTKKKREKFDSGLGDEIVENHSETSEDFISSSDEDHQEKRNKRGQKCEHEPRGFLKWRRIESNIHRIVGESSSENDNEEEVKVDNEMRMHQSPYSDRMRAKIQALPLPPILKRYSAGPGILLT
ncbi:hypothetical protein JTB14_008092 [Gonioctena quinquepunctata]|nr:hypothetical protein JTB14_008092 [Gonioctena quinquepunctata]